MPEQVGLNIEKIAILGPFGLFLDPLGASPCNIFFLLEISTISTMTHCESLFCFEGCKNTKNNSEKRGKRRFWGQFWANFDHFWKIGATVII